MCLRTTGATSALDVGRTAAAAPTLQERASCVGCHVSIGRVYAEHFYLSWAVSSWRFWAAHLAPTIQIIEVGFNFELVHNVGEFRGHGSDN